jgi:hypothetical protein
MSEFTIDKILLFTMFFVPGFVYLKAYRLFIAETKTDFSKDLYEAIGISLINAIICSPILYLIYVHNFIVSHPFLSYFIFLLIVIVAPICELLTFRKVSKTKWYLELCLTPNNSPWDDFFSKRESYWVIVTLKSGRKIGGKYATKSYGSAYPAPKEIYLEEVWKLDKDNKFGDMIERTQGIFITEGEISTIEFFH